MTDKELTREEVYNFVKIDKRVSNSDIFQTCRVIQSQLFEQDINLINLGEIFWWLVEKRDKLKKEQDDKRKEKRKS